MTTREQMYKIAADVIEGKRVGDVEAAWIIIGQLQWLPTRDLLLGQATSDDEAAKEINEMILRARQEKSLQQMIAAAAAE